MTGTGEKGLIQKMEEFSLFSVLASTDRNFPLRTITNEGILCFIQMNTSKKKKSLKQNMCIFFIRVKTIWFFSLTEFAELCS